MKKYAILGILTLTPAIAFASSHGLEGVLGKILNLVDVALPIIVAIAVLFFFIGLAKYILNTGDEEKKSEGRNIMIWGIITLFIMVSVWGLVNILLETFDLKGNEKIKVPSVKDIGR